MTKVQELWNEFRYSVIKEEAATHKPTVEELSRLRQAYVAGLMVGATQFKSDPTEMVNLIEEVGAYISENEVVIFNRAERSL